MAKFRCVSTEVLYGSAFYNLTDKAKVAYVLYLLNTDDWGFVENTELCLKIANAGKKERDEIIKSGLVMVVDDMEIIKHFNIHNKNLYASKRQPTRYIEEFEKLTLNSRKEYIFKEQK